MNFFSIVLWRVLFILLLSPILAGNAFCGQKALIKTGDLFPEIALKTPYDPKDAVYLGISEGASFHVSDVKADLLLVEVMNINCGSCQQQAPVYNKLYELIASSPEAKDRIKMMAIGAGSPEKYIKDYRDYFKAPYPIIEDPALNVYNAVGKGPVPMAIYVRPMLEGRPGVVAGTHEGLNEDYEAMFEEMKSYMAMDLATIMKAGGEEDEQIVTVEPIMSDEELKIKIESALKGEGTLEGGVEEIDLDQHGIVYTVVVEKEKSKSRLFARVVSESPPCDLCHDTHFIYIFDKKGVIRSFVPLQLTKYGNDEWDSKDIDQICGKVLGHLLEDPLYFDAKVDAVSSATITSMLIFRSINEGKALFETLKAGNWIK